MKSLALLAILGMALMVKVSLDAPKVQRITTVRTVTYQTWAQFPSDGKHIADQGNNPGCITAGYDKYDTMAIGYIRTGSYKFLVFPDSATGWKALGLRIKQSQDETITEFLHAYCRNLPLSYLSGVLAAINAKPMDRVGDHDDVEIAKIIAKLEGWTHGTKYPIRMISQRSDTLKRK